MEWLCTPGNYGYKVRVFSGGVANYKGGVTL